MIGIGLDISKRRGGASGPNGTPSGLTLTVISATENQLDWTRGATNEDYAIVQRSDDGGGYSNLVWLAPGTITYTDTTALVGILYYYRIVLIKGSIYSAYSNAVNNLTGDIATGLVGQWLFNESSGATALDTASTNNGTIAGADRIVGKQGMGLSLDGTLNTDSVKIADVLDSTFAGANKQFTISAYIKPTAGNVASRFIISKYSEGATGQREFYCAVTDTNYLRVSWWSGPSSLGSYRTYTCSTTLITDTNRWYFVEFKYDGTNATINNRVTVFVDTVQETGSITAFQDGFTPPMGPIVDCTSILTIGACTQTDDTTKYNFLGSIDSVNIFNKITTYADDLKLKYLNHVVPESTARLFSYDAGSQYDYFADSLYTSLISGTTFSVNKPQKNQNPLLEAGVNSATWDHDKNYNTVLKIGGIWYMWYAGVTATGEKYVCRATSTDGITWTKDNLGLIIYDGNTNNNIIFGQGWFNASFIYDADGAADRKYVSVNEQRVGDVTGGSVYLYISPDGITFTLVKTLTLTASFYSEAREIIKRADGRWLAYYVRGHVAGLRAIGAWLSDTTDLEGTWTDQGIVISTTLSTEQKYGIGIEKIDDIYYGFVPIYNSTTEQMFMALYASRTGLSWTLLKKTWIPLGSSGAWDDAMILTGTSLVADGNNLRYYYSGFPQEHDDPLPRDSRIGYATIGNKRLATIEGSGTFITTAFTPTEPLMINADLTNGTLQIELLLAADDSVIAGYSKDDMDVITGDTYSTEVKWGGNSIPTDTEIKLKFYLT